MLNKLFGKPNKENKGNDSISKTSWLPLTNLEQIDQIKTKSEKETVFIFKHSTRCGISRMVLRQFEKIISENPVKFEIYYLDLLNYRNVSDEIGYTFQVLHQSPQLLVIRNGSCMHHTSHYDITEIDLSRFI